MPQIQPWSLRTCPGVSDPTLEHQNQALEPQMQPWSLRSSPGHSDQALEPQIKPWSIRSSPGASDPALEQHRSSQERPRNSQQRPGAREEQRKSTPGVAQEQKTIVFVMKMACSGYCHSSSKAPNHCFCNENDRFRVLPQQV